MYAKAPFGDPQAVIEYPGRYTHKVAISNHRIQSINEDNGTVTFCYKDYADEEKQKQMTLTSDEFMRRFEQHICPACKNKTLQLVKIFYPWKQAGDG